MKLGVLLTLILTLVSLAVPGAHAREINVQPAQEASKQKPDETAQNLERIKSKVPAERRDAIDKLADSGDPRAVEPTDGPELRKDTLIDERKA